MAHSRKSRPTAPVPAKTAARATGPNRNERVWAVVHRIPRGRVATYGQIAAQAALPGPTGPRQVGYALAALAPGTTIPWQRVVNAQGRISLRGASDGDCRQRELLALEGVEFGLDGAIDLARYGWQR
jgi:methylated-DNA-protein-cysteine methyltransferase-like protein